jgi:hypothetical protein
MRSQLRVRVTLPVAVLGLLGIGVGAFAMGGPPEGSGAPATTPATTATTTEKDPSAERVSRAAWAARANRLCAKANSEARALGMPTNPQDTVAYLEDLIEIARRAEPAFVALGWPRGEMARVEKLWTLTAAGIDVAADMLEALKAGDQERFLQLLGRLKRSGDAYDKLVVKLGAQRCTEDVFASADPEQGLAGALEENKVVVVLFYAPGSTYDTIQAREARAGAVLGGAGFLAVDVSKDHQVASLAAAFEVRDAPAILVVKRGFRVAVRINDFADRETVAQAAANAR